MQTEITRVFEIDAGHRIHGHESKCANLHGHRYKIMVTIRGPQLDALGRVVDFGVIKELIGTWLDENWDHGMILWLGDPIVALYEEGGRDVPGALAGQKHYLMADNPTAENMSQHLLHEVIPHLLDAAFDERLICTRVGVWETPNCYAESQL